MGARDVGLEVGCRILDCFECATCRRGGGRMDENRLA